MQCFPETKTKAVERDKQAHQKDMMAQVEWDTCIVSTHSLTPAL